ncbi:MAG TPA: trigger factor [Tepidisphaeraceae bacterium]|nr:trigger factor [Tepidisphaeraceae bacterium]
MAADQAVAEQTETFDYPVTIEDAGPATKKVSVQIPADRVQAKLQQELKDLRRNAALPGFRVGHAPQKLIEKKFATELRDQVRRTLISESYEQAIEKNSLQVIGEPEFENPDAIKLEDNQPLNYSFSVEVQPDINLPELKGLKVKKPKIDIKDENVDQAMTNLREQQGTLVPVEDRGVETKDFLTADVHTKVNGETIDHAHDAQIVARAGRVAGIQIDDLDKQLAGLKAGETRSVTVKGPENHPNEKYRNQDVEVEFKLKDLKRLEPAEVTPEFLEGLGFANEQELRDALREQMVERITFDVQQSMREQVSKYLLDNVKIDLPSKLSDRQADRVVQRRAVELMQRGLPAEAIQQNVEALKSGAKDEAARDLKLFFILQRIAADQNVDVDEAELNGRVAMIAAQRGERPEKLKQTMAKEGSLANLYIQMREQKAVDSIIANAEVEEVDVNQMPGAPEGEKKAE